LPNSELTEIEVSLQTLVRRAYDMGRNDALKKVVDVLNADRPCADQLALMAPGTFTPEPESEPEPAIANGQETSRQGKPWWAWPVR
jgi:hypothetical protein